MSSTIRIAVIGHTNAGKTSLLRTLMRDRAFGEVSSRPATTRHVEATTLRLPGALELELADTPGLEDSMGLLDALHAADPSPRATGAARIAAFLAGPLATGDFAQEAKALRQLLASDLALYVVDAREPVLGKYQDEFAIIAASGRPCLVVLNFIATPAAEPARWRTALQSAGIHNVSTFDTVVFDAEDERRLWQQIGLLLPAAEAHCTALVAARARELLAQREQAARLIADALIDCLALRELLDGRGRSALVDKVRRREHALSRDLLGLFRFVEADFAGCDLPLAGAVWTFDAFDTDLLKELGLSLGTSAAKGAAAGAVVDALTAFHSLGAATLIGGALGAGLDAASRIGRHARERWRGERYEQLDEAAALFIARRAVLLVQDLSCRGHAAMSPLAARTELGKSLPDEERLRKYLARAARHPGWSALGADPDLSDTARQRTLVRLWRTLLPALHAPAGA
jgi:transposase